MQMTAWTLMVAWDEAVYRDHARVVAYLRSVGVGSSHMVQLFVLNTIGIVELGRMIMVLAEGMAHFITPPASASDRGLHPISHRL